jgi:hypothetical protein
MNKVFQSHFKSLLVNFLFVFYSELSMAIFCQESKTDLIEVFVFKITRLHGPHRKHCLIVDACLHMRCLATDSLYLHAFARCGLHRKNSFPSIIVSIWVYRAIAGNALITSVTIWPS